jgi:nitrite reductase/ring-hydroxylating ferredoxin subunit
MALRLRVCAVTDVAPGECKGFAVEGVAVPIMVTNVDGELFATSSMCPHEDVSLLDGDRDGTSVTCKGHGYELDLATGECSHDPELRLKCYRIRIVGDDLYVDLI